MRKIDLGAGTVSPEGFEPFGRLHGTDIFPLSLPDASVDEIRASHCLEHFPKGQTLDVLREWMRVLKPGGRLRVAVPDFEKVAKNYIEGVNQPTEAYVVGGQLDEDDFHKAVFDRARLRRVLSDCGLVLLRPWTSELEDCAAYDISLNIEGTKPFYSEMKFSAAMSVPRLGFMDNFFCAFESFVPLGIRLRKMGGAYWGQALTHCLEKIIEQDKPDAIIVMDYDTVMTVSMVAQLMQLAMVYPEADAIAPLQSSRHVPLTMFTVKGDDGQNVNRVDLRTFQGDLRRVNTAHFGLTLIRVNKLLALPKPWFHSTPDSEGGWETDKGKIDEDEGFWKRWEAAGNSLYLASRLAIGHAELMVRWPGKDLATIYQPIRDFNENGPPADAWS